jgi:hypothetical protein
MKGSGYRTNWLDVYRYFVDRLEKLAKIAEFILVLSIKLFIYRDLSILGGLIEGKGIS